METVNKFGMAIMVFSLLVGACAPSTQNPPTATATIVASPTVVQTPTIPVGMINVGEGWIPDLRVSNPELLDTNVSISPIVQFVKAMNTAGIEVTAQQVLDALEDTAYYEARTDTNGNPYVQFAYTITTADLSYSTGFLYDEQGGWRPFTLRDLGAKRNLRFGTSGSGWLNEDTTEFMLATQQIDSIVPWPVWVQLQPEPNTFDFSALEQEIARWHVEKKVVQNVPLVIASGDWSLPDWLKHGSFSKDELARILQEYITAVVTHGKERGITQWIVVSEPYLPVHREDDLFYKIFEGYDYIDLAFEAARKADAQATLIYNDIDNYDSGGVTTALTHDIVERLHSKGLIDALGIQAHLGDWAGVPDFDDVRTTLQGYGVPVVVTEFDYNLVGVSSPKNQREAQKASVFHDFLSAVLDAGVTDITFSGLDERTSGLEKAGQRDADPTMFNMWVEPQPAYYAVLNALSQPTVISTAAPTVVMMNIDGLSVPDPKTSNPELFDLANPHSPILKFANAFEITLQEVGDLTPTILTDINGSSFVVLTTNDLPATTDFDESGIPLLIADQGEDEQWAWSESTLKGLAEKQGLKLGSSSVIDLTFDNELREFFYEQYNAVTIDYGIYWANVEPARGQFDFTILDAQAEVAHEHGVTIRGHALVFPQLFPDWLKNGEFSKEELSQILIDHIQKVVSHGKELGITEWVVVNEPYLPSYREEDDVFYKTFGDYSYIDIAFQAAREADSSAMLIYNDTDNHSTDGLTTQLTSKIIKQLNDKRLIDAVGIQAHIGDWVAVPDYDNVFNTVSGYRLPIVITELDYNLVGVTGDDKERLMKQAQVYQNLVRAVINAGAKEITFWDVYDGYEAGRAPSQSISFATMYDQDLMPKPNYYAVSQLLLKNLLEKQ
jgi:GH35 family endo-1,4-beta-xylanase